MLDYSKSTGLSHPLKCPSVSICTLTHNRNTCLPLLRTCVEKQDYPRSKIEWLILDDSTSYSGNLSIDPIPGMSVKYQRASSKLALGRKRNLAHKLCSGDIIVYMDDDDFYSASRVRHCVQTLINSGHHIAGCTTLPIYFSDTSEMWLSGPFGNKHATAGTFAMTREFSQANIYNPDSSCNEEREFLRNYTIPLAQLDPLKTMVCISHASNTFDKKNMIRNGETPRMRKIQMSELGSLGKEFLSSPFPRENSLKN